MKYLELKQRQQKEVNDFPFGFAFSNQQFKEMMEKFGLKETDTDKIYSIGAGGYIRKSDSNAFDEMFKRHRKEIEDEIERKELYKTFKQVAKKYLSLQRELDEDYIVVIAKSPADLIKEGSELNHCVGRMNYDQKFAREESLIFFVRNKHNIDKPFVTMEYSLKSNKTLQCYAEHNSKPQTEVQDFVNKKWLPYANRKIKKVA